MRARRFSVMAAGLGALSMTLPSVAAPRADTPARSFALPPEVSGRELLVRFVPGTTPGEQAAIAARHGAAVISFHPDLGVVRLRLGTDRIMPARSRLLEESGVVSAEPNRSLKAQANPNDSLWAAYQWGPKKMKVPEAWDIYPGSFTNNQGNRATGVPIAVVDSGIDLVHPDLRDGRILTQHGANCVNSEAVCGSDSVLDDSFGHGTGVAGMIGAITNNLKGVAGVAFNSPIIPVKVLDGEDGGTELMVSAGVLWAAQQGAKVINLSLGTPFETPTLCSTIAQVVNDYGAIVVASAGNGGWYGPSYEHVWYPGACPAAMAMGPTDANDEFGFDPFFCNCRFGSRGPQMWAGAPGVAILSTWLSTDGDGIDYISWIGSSSAAAQVSAIAALVANAASGVSTPPATIRRILAETADKVGLDAFGPDPNSLGCSPECTWNSQLGYGRINAQRAVEAAFGVDPDFTLSAQHPSGVNTNRGQSGTATINIKRENGLTDPVAFSISGIPSGASATFSPPSTSGASSVLTIAAGTATTTGRYLLTVTGTSGALVRTVKLVLRIGHVESQSYVGVTGDLFNFSCAGVAVGGACLPVRSGDRYVSINIDDDVSQYVGAYYRFLAPDGETLGDGVICTSASLLPVPWDSPQFLQLFVEEGLSTLDCAGRPGAATRGTIAATFVP